MVKPGSVLVTVVLTVIKIGGKVVVKVDGGDCIVSVGCGKLTVTGG
ncbi:hypothetical protein HERIO_2719 [Hepatospora eriocheir]|uniref:Uncharacterized protein n=1 Tax=Hepatospora eriocheir TaxID=1081669 RepID=A0A1X0QB80_9MICR|nr:hypothetical protein HERIO_2719 [Hepatospora eriocheir]